MDDLQEAEALEAALDALGDSPTTAQILDVLKGGYRDAGVAAALKRTAGGGGGSEPVSCVVAREAGLDIRTASKPVLWDALYNNYWDQDPLVAIPDGLGLSFAFDGTDEEITVTEAGIWTLTAYCFRAADATWAGSWNNNIVQRASWVGDAARAQAIFAETVVLPVDASWNPTIEVELAATANPYNTATAVMSIVRLG